MKKLLISIFILLFLLTSCGKPKKLADMSNCIIDYGNSEIYSHEKLDEGINTIKKEFSQSYDYTLYSIKYTNDEKSLSELAYYNPYYENRYIECMVFVSDFKAPPYDTVVYEANEKITDWQWILVREKNGDWIILTSGYC
ncbi:MAG: hypothetical protein IJD45_03640 [Clostridia bacterium]|nr:hypothetical protein [Clostridia bacterium]